MAILNEVKQRMRLIYASFFYGGMSGFRERSKVINKVNVWHRK